MLFERIEQMASELGLSVTDVAQLSELHYSTMPGWKRRVSNGMWANDLPGEKFILYAVRWMMNPTWFMSNGETYERWSPEMVAARRALRPWARTVDLNTPRERLVAVWQKLNELAPTLREDIWAAFLLWVRCERTGSTSSGNYEYAGIHYDEWRKCKAGEIHPGEAQLQGAAFLTGLPLKWFETGDLKFIEEPTAVDVSDFFAAAKAADVTPDEIIRFYLQHKASLR